MERVLRWRSSIRHTVEAFCDERGPCVQKNIPFMKEKAWIRHDEHYHVDFSVACKPL